MSGTHTPTGAQNNGVKTVDSVAEAVRMILVDAVGAALDLASKKGAPSFANNQVTAGVASAQVVAARATRRAVLIRNTDAANSAYVGTGVVTSGNGFLLKAGESISIETTAAVNAIRATADVLLAYLETYD